MSGHLATLAVHVVWASLCSQADGKSRMILLVKTKLEDWIFLCFKLGSSPSQRAAVYEGAFLPIPATCLTCDGCSEKTEAETDHVDVSKSERGWAHGRKHEAIA